MIRICSATAQIERERPGREMGAEKKRADFTGERKKMVDTASGFSKKNDRQSFHLSVTSISQQCFAFIYVLFHRISQPAPAYLVYTQIQNYSRAGFARTPIPLCVSVSCSPVQLLRSGYLTRVRPYRRVYGKRTSLGASNCFPRRRKVPPEIGRSSECHRQIGLPRIVFADDPAEVGGGP